MKKRQKNGEILDIEERKIIARSALFKIAGNIKTKEEEELERKLKLKRKLTHRALTLSNDQLKQEPKILTETEADIHDNI